MTRLSLCKTLLSLHTQEWGGGSKKGRLDSTAAICMCIKGSTCTATLPFLLWITWSLAADYKKTRCSHISCQSLTIHFPE